ncbi:hypothetical protein NLA06_03140 [Desulfomicrobium sp. ZS1]|uniref:hypothetical protein n=1 Tax=Desulfomicrobium sp. ZS1 TaxID=2952228 RepID=UPI0020B3FD79|nr:hypothetical protein [Desulfomicrobium sp. ZS1]UTF50905.1 hypothetical protein NLA06_03140 [Desulfomicrobium sp. ZS1]
MGAAQIIEDKKIDIEIEVARIAINLGWLVNAMKANGDSPAAEILDGITRQLDSLVGPIAEMQREVRP